MSPEQPTTPSSPEIDQLQSEIEETRAQLADTVDQLAAKADVKARAKAQAADLRDRATGPDGSPRPSVLLGAVAAVGLVVGLVVWKRRR